MHSFAKVVTAATLIFSALIATPPHASAEGFFDALARAFGAQQRPRETPQSYRETSRPTIDRTLAYGAPSSPFGDPLNPQFPPATRPPSPARTSYCVRTCDGRYFPLNTNDRASSAKTCSAMCPASATKVFSGSTIDEAASPDGKRYSDLGNAFLYRTKMVEGCTCNGKDAVGLSAIDLTKDPTLRSGDIVATADGMKMFKGSSGDNHKAAEFKPIENARLPAGERRRLVSIRVTP